jgi:hypothetical protein
LWAGGDANPGIKTFFKASVELSKILVEAPSGIGGGRVLVGICEHAPANLTGDIQQSLVESWMSALPSTQKLTPAMAPAMMVDFHVFSGT